MLLAFAEVISLFQSEQQEFLKLLLLFHQQPDLERNL